MATISRSRTAAPATTDAARSEVAEHLRLTIARSARAIRQQVDSGLTPSQRSVLATTARHGPLTPSELAQLERISRPTATRLIARLRERGLVDCVPDTADGRSYSIKLSRSGAKLRKLGHTRKNEYVAKKLRNLDDADVELLRRAADLLNRLLIEQT